MIAEQDGSSASRSGRPAIGALVALAILAAGCHGPAAPCPTGAALEVDLDAWQEAAHALAQARRAAPDYAALLAQLGLEPIAHRPIEGESPEDGAMTLTELEITPVRRGANRPADWLVAAWFREAGGAESLRAQLLRPLAGREDTWCPLGTDLSHDKARFEEPCIEAHVGPARDLGIEQLVAPARDAIVTRDAGGWCGPGPSRGDRFATSYWGTEQGRLVRYLEVVTYEAWYESPAPPAEARRGAIALSHDWPRTITLTETIECPPADEMPPDATDCRPGKRTIRYRYADSRYAAIAKPSPADAAPTGTEEPRQ